MPVANSLLMADNSVDRVAALAWMRLGTQFLIDTLGRLSDSELDAALGLPGWTRRHLLAHVAANAEALQRLVHWARTGEERRMYSTGQQRNADIEAGSARRAAHLREWVSGSAVALEHALATLDEQAWAAEVVTAQGRTVPASEIPWMRDREIMVHVVDLDAGVGFADLPDDFLAALVTDVSRKRSPDQVPSLSVRTDDGKHRWHVGASGAPVTVVGSLPELAAWLTGRPTSLSTADGGPLPTLLAWL